MPSTSISRRRLLAAGGGCLSAAFAGCVEFSEGESVSGHSSEGGTFESTHEYESLSIRSADDTPVAYSSEDAAEDGDENREPRHLDTVFVTNEDDATALWFTDAAADDDVDTARAFVEETNFESETVVVDQRSIDDCYRRHLLGVRAADDEFRTSYCREMKAATEPCEADKTVVEAIFVRVHRPYGDPPSSRGSSERTTCPSDAGVANGSAANETDGNGTETGADGTGTENETHEPDTSSTEGQR
ncbi:hypothetical protein Htur_1789 [Haloterrigena turkmenica DSM 5511]|uniref:Uncharacterized protein n=1 Tax=Haloterrigena turkmenica (strain ATCC 51198 / DSM 5511 / JCM 9101 / NCIMB 13204 / VKM B-1734 / 4k) TaxID=543526 RepID=D2RS93_HALTV|nr:hypothetical protein [Haloterrigena turkmenica]ADB60674.1 hypothetical protein Htur_1789 [Haloterrigena turkmenica DSM 5511]